MNNQPKQRDSDPQCIRQQLQKRFPGFTQGFWTWLTGVALTKQVPLLIWRPWQRALALIAQIYIAATLGALLLNDLFTGGDLWT